MLDWLTALSKSNFLGLAILIPAAVFAGFMALWFRSPIGRQTLIAYFFEAVSIEAAAVLLFSLFNKQLFETIGENKLFLIIVTLNTIVYGLRDVFGRVRQPDTIVSISQMKNQDMKR